MAAKTKIKVPIHKSDARFVLSSAAIITLFFFTSLRDPFNAPKLWLNILLGAFLLAHLVLDIASGRFAENQKQLKILSWILGLFVGFMLVAALVGEVKYITFFGDNQRNTGWLDYFFLSIFLYSAAKHIRLSKVNLVYWFAIGVGAVMTEYGVLQHFGHDFVKWNNPYNSIISTVGNPDFAGGIMAVFLTLSVVAVVASGWNLWIRLTIACQAIVTLLVIVWSNARQGLLSFGFGLGIITICFVWYKWRRVGQGLAAIGILSFVFTLAGIFQKGPLTHYLYKPSVSIRGYYWRAGWQMFIHHPWFGVGPDRYGAWFRTYRSIEYPLSYGFDITSTAAHNVVIELFATCGIFVGLAYVGLLGFVIYRGVVAIKRSTGQAKLLTTGLLAAWFAYQSQSIVSIDNIGIAIWGWILSGAVIGISLVENPTEVAQQGIRRANKSSSLATFKPIASVAMVLLGLILVVPQARGESSTFHLSAYAVPTQAQGQANRDAYHQLVVSDLAIPMLNPQYRLLMASNLAQAGYVDEAFTQINNEIKSDPRDYGAYGMEASFYEQLHQNNKAIPARLKMRDLDPWGAKILLSLGQDYLAIGDKASAKKYGAEILNMAKIGHPQSGSGYFDIQSQAKSQLGA